MELSKRLSCLVRGIAPGSCVADVGCGHGQASLWLAQQGYRVIACDISAPTLGKAKQLCERVSPDLSIDFRLCSGLDLLSPGEASVIIIAGMGGHTMTDILSAHPEIICRSDTLLALQSQNDLAHLRSFLRDGGFRFVSDEVVFSDGRYYTCIKAVYSGTIASESELWAFTGDPGLMAKSSDYPDYLRFEIARLTRILSGISAGNEHQAEMVRLLERYKVIAHELYGW